MDKPKLNEIETITCGPDCACNTPSKGKGIKIAISLIALVGVVGILAYKYINSSSASNETADPQNSMFSIAQAARNTDGQSLNVMGISSSTSSDKIGEYIESLSDLNKVALNQDAVFIFIPHGNNEMVQPQTGESVVAAQKTLKKSNITLGLYTLSVGSPDHTGISRQVKTPAFLIASKGRGMVAVNGDITETKLLQGFIAASSKGGCCPPGGNKKPGCK